eukprot:PhF_6_TR2175/c0_g4_i1/m.3557
MVHSATNTSEYRATSTASVLFVYDHNSFDSIDVFCDNVRAAVGSTVIIHFNESGNLTESCLLPTGTRNITIMCSAGVVLTCPKQQHACFSVNEGPVPSLTVQGCTLKGIGIDYNVWGGNVAIEGCVLDGMGTQHPVSIYNAHNLTIRNSVAINGLYKSLYSGGGCMTLRGIRGVTVLQHLVIQGCTSSRAGGGVLIEGLNVTSEDEPTLHLDDSQFGGDVFIQNVSISYCRSTTVSGGGMNINNIRSVIVADSRFEYNTALEFSGCLGIGGVRLGEFVIKNVFLYNCTAVRGCGGAIALAPDSNATGHALHPVEIYNLTLLKSFAGSCGGGIRMSNTERHVLIQNIVLEDSVAGERGGGLEFRIVSQLAMDNVTLRRCASPGDAAAMSVGVAGNVTVRDLNVYD